MTKDTPLILASLTPSQPRRVIATGTVAALATLLIWVAGVTPAALGWKLVLFATGLAAGWAALSMWQATAVGILLTEEGLVQTDGTLIAAMDEIAHVDRGVFAVKPSNGVVVRLASRHPYGWAPGVWWRTGRRLGVGGVTSAAGAKAMADILAMRLADPRVR